MAVAKPAGAWTYEDLFALPDDGKRYEIIDGELYEMPAPTSAHAITIANIVTMLIPLILRLGGRWLTAPLDVFVPGGNPVQPDILVILPDGAAQIVPRGVVGPPDLAIEVISPGNKRHDLVCKRLLYAHAGVREYWLVDPELRTLEILALDGDAYRLAVAASGQDQPVSPLLGTLPLAANDLFAGIEG